MTEPDPIVVINPPPPAPVVVLAPPQAPDLDISPPGLGGPPGPVGPPGPTGPSGGAPGQPRFTGTGPPGLILGAEPMDEYLDISSGDIYRLD